MARHDPDPPITEPEIVHCLFSTGTEVEVTAHFARIVAWVDIPRLATELPERRIIARVVLPDNVARELTRQLQRGLAKGGH
jgi:hypothetical protein